MDPKRIHSFQLSGALPLAATAVPLTRYASKIRTFGVRILLDKLCNICYIYYRGANQLFAKVKLIAERSIMTKVIRLNEETVRLLEIYRKIVAREFNHQNSKIDEKILKNDNLILQSALMWSIDTSC